MLTLDVLMLKGLYSNSRGRSSASDDTLTYVAFARSSNKSALTFCRDCAIDPTCVMCMDCFQGSVHKSHRYKVGVNRNVYVFNDIQINMFCFCQLVPPGINGNNRKLHFREFLF